MFGFGSQLFINRPAVAAPTNSVLYTGANIVSLESVTYNLYDPASGPPPGYYPTHSDTLLQWLYDSGLRQARVMFSMEAVSIYQYGTIVCPVTGSNDPLGYYVAYWNTLVSLVNRLIALGIRVLVEPWQYSAVTGDTNICYQGATFSTNIFSVFWYNFSNSFNSAITDISLLSYGLINEPHQGAIVGGSTIAEWYSYAQAAVTGIRNAGVNNRIFISGWNYADCKLFVSNGSAAQHLLLSDPRNNLGVEVHNYRGQLTTTGNDSSSTALTDAMTDLVAWSRANGDILINVGELAIDAGAPNGTLAVAQAQWAAWQAYCVANNDIITAWQWWAVSEDAWWSTSDSSYGFNWGLTDGSDTTDSVYMTLIKSTLGAW